MTLSRKLSIKPSIAAMIGAWPEWKWRGEVRANDLVIGWGYRKSGLKALRVALRRGAEARLLEDGFLRSVDRDGAEIGIALDHQGIYYDATSRSRLFDLIKRPLSPVELERAGRLAERWCDLGLSKYNGSRHYGGTLPDRYVLVIDQVEGDLSIRNGLAGRQDFEAMLEAALAHDPGIAVVLKTHPDAAGKPRKSHFDIEALDGSPRLQVVSDASHVAPFIAQSEAVYTVTSQVGFEALLHRKPVHVFGMPFYAGWGLTIDQLDPPEGRQRVSLEQLTHAALVDYSRYYHPVRRDTIEAEDAMDLVGRNAALRRALPSTIYALGFSRWKRSFIADFLAGSDVRFVASIGQVPSGAPIVRWGREAATAPVSRETYRIEDGFLRSSGLGANLVRPLSLVVDDLGIYYDASRPSRLEDILATRDFSDMERARARALREQIVAARLNKYNLGGRSWERPETDREVILVVGQVEEDASIAFGSPELKTNGALLRRVRSENPDAYIVYKPHPDVLAGLRKAGTDLTAGNMPYDELVEDCEPTSLLDSIDRLHTMTSLMGFEALMRGVPVTCHGVPFYAGWGLTEDRLSCERRGRTRDLDELVHAALIDYPRYFSPRGRMFASPEDILVELADLAMAGPARRSLPRQMIFWLVTRWVKVRGRK